MAALPASRPHLLRGYGGCIYPTRSAVILLVPVFGMPVLHHVLASTFLALHQPCSFRFLAACQYLSYHTGGLPPVSIRWVLICDPDGKFEPQALVSTNPEATPKEIVEWFVMRWQLEVTFEEARAHLGIETQRQWSDLAILRTTPVLLGLFSLVTLFAHHLLQGRELPVRQAAWYNKGLPTFSDTLAFVRQQLWPVSISWMSPEEVDMVKIPKALLSRLLDALAYAA
jgi:hypothetical protein